MNSKPWMFVALGFGLLFAISAGMTFAPLSSRQQKDGQANTTQAIAPSPVPSSSVPPSPLPLVKSSPPMPTVQPDGVYDVEGISVRVKTIEVNDLGVKITARFKNETTRPIYVYVRLSTVVVGDRQLDFNGKGGELSSEIQPGIEQEATLFYAPQTGLFDARQVDSVKWIFKDVPPIELAVSRPKKKTAQPATVSEGLEGEFNAEIFAPPSNCRTGPGSSNSVKKALQRGDVLVDVSDPRPDSKGGTWLREKYLDCWIHESQLRFK